MQEPIEYQPANIIRRIEKLEEAERKWDFTTRDVSYKSDIRGYLENHSQRLESIEQKQEAHSDVLGQLVNIGEETKATLAEHTKRFDKLEQIMMQILNRLPKAEGE